MAGTKLDSKNLEVGPANVYATESIKAQLETVLAGLNDDLRYVAVGAGASGNNITVTYAVAGSGTALSVGVVGNDITVNVATNASGVAISTAEEVRAKIADTAAAAALVTVELASGNDGTGVVSALAQTNLFGGADSARILLGFLGDDLVVTTTTEATPLTGAQTGTIPQDKVVTGGTFQITIPFKEIILDNFRRAFPNAVVVEGPLGKRLDFKSQVGLSLRGQSVKLEIIKIVGGLESALKEDIIVIPEAAAADAEVTIPFSPTEQRVITATFEAWPDAAGRWAFTGDEKPF